MSAVAIIPARGGSRRIPRKNIKLFHGKPIIAYSIEAARKCSEMNDFGFFDRIIVSTDDGEIADIAGKYGADIHWRGREVDWGKTEASERMVNGRRQVHYKPWPDDGSKGTQEVARDVLLRGYRGIDFVCVIYATAPMLDIYDLWEGYRAVKQEKFTYAFSVGANPLRDAAQFYWGWVPSVMRRDPLVSASTGLVVIEDERICDINTPEDWAKAEEMYAALHKEKT